MSQAVDERRLRVAKRHPRSPPRIPPASPAGFHIQLLEQHLTRQQRFRGDFAEQGLSLTLESLGGELFTAIGVP